MNNLIVSKNEATMTSRDIAELVESRHDKVKQSIERLVERNVISKPPMGDGEKSANGVIEKLYLINKRDSYVIVAQLSPEFTAKLVDRWQELEGAQKQLSPMEMVILSAQAVLKVEQEQAAQSKRLDAIEAKQNAILDGHGFYSILGYSKLKGVKLDVKQSAAMGKKATSESKKHGIMMGTVPDARHGTVKTYHSDVLEIVFA